MDVMALQEDPVLSRIDSDRIGSAFAELLARTREKTGLVRELIAHTWQRRQRARLMAGTGTRLNGLGASLRRCLSGLRHPTDGDGKCTGGEEMTHGFMVLGVVAVGVVQAAGHCSAASKARWQFNSTHYPMTVHSASMRAFTPSASVRLKEREKLMAAPTLMRKPTIGWGSVSDHSPKAAKSM